MGFIRINNRNNFLLKEIPSYHPSTIKYHKFWGGEFRKIIEGLWAQDTVEEDALGSWRWMPPNLYFYVNFGTIKHKPEEAPKTAPKIKMKPILRDVEWEIFYNIIEARGFSGFEGDDYYTCCRDLIDDSLDTEYYDLSCFNKRGRLKTFIKAHEYLRKLHPVNYGRPLYQNEAKNLFLLSARGVGKSFDVGGGVIAHELITDGRKYYEINDILPTVEIFVGSGIASKSTELLDKVKDTMNNLSGVWKPNTDEEVPAPFYKEMSGSLVPTKKWVHKYQKKVGGKWKDFGTNSTVHHGIFTTENPEAAAGGRYTVIVVEEVGLTPNMLTIQGSNEAAMIVDAYKTGSAFYIGTGGNILKIVESEIIFRDPDSFECLAFDDELENSGKIGFFISAVYKDNKFKDKNGNTDVERATAHYEKRRAKKKKAKSSAALDLEMMNFPLVPSEMFLNKVNSKFPMADLKYRYGELMGSKKILDLSWKGHLRIDEEGKVKWMNEDIAPIREFPFKGNDNMEGSIEIFEMPSIGEDGKVPWGVYIGSLDPVDDDDNSDITRSLQSTFIMNLLTGRIVAEYTGRTRLAKEYYEQVRRLLMFYNATIMYENQKKGFYAYFDNKKSLYLLAETPQLLIDKEMQKSVGIGNKSYGINANVAVNNWGIELQIGWMEEQAYGKEEGIKNLNILRIPAYLKECILYGNVINTDRISSMIQLMIYREDRVKMIESMRDTSIKTTPQNPYWKKVYRLHKKNQYIMNNK